MKPEDDPEARIRELERPLIETAHTSENSHTHAPGGYTHPPGTAIPPMPPPVNYGASFPQTSRRSTSRLRWILIGIFIIGPIAFAGLTAVNTAHQISRGGLTTVSPNPSPSNAPNSLPNSATQTPSAAPSAPPPAGPLPPAGGNLSVNNINGNQTITCNDSIVTVSGVSNVVVLRGHCKSLATSGVQNSITVDAVDSIDVSGFNNQVIYHTGSPRIDKSGVGNVVQQG
ncbi:MAG: DUF3060 domain-containing protein [Mycobacterium sp.]|nr:DUF3060 domain-containing protein [Mycobacterium sp.]MBV9722705.1 DUF3060 domain-containing protein [Mycobacterium sp.]